MARKKISASDTSAASSSQSVRIGQYGHSAEAEQIRHDLIQQLINCDTWIYRTIGNPEAQQVWVERKNDLEFQVDQLEQQNKIGLI